MQTFLPYKSFEKSMQVLDYRRLGKQRVETGQILEILTGKAFLPKNVLLDSDGNWTPNKKGWSNHPAVKMWCGYEEYLKYYLSANINEWIIRGYRNTIALPQFNLSENSVPLFLGCESFHESHRSNLLRKNREHYLVYWNCKDNLEYVWPKEKS